MTAVLRLAVAFDEIKSFELDSSRWHQLVSFGERSVTVTFSTRGGVQGTAHLRGQAADAAAAFASVWRSCSAC